MLRASVINGDRHGGELRRRAHGKGRKRTEGAWLQGRERSRGSTSFNREEEGRGEGTRGEKMVGH
jgi:hypothetical protein